MAKLVPNGKQTFLDANGDPLSSGLVYMYVPASTTDKDTWEDSAETTLNVNPVELDAAGRAVIYGDGIYRQLVKDSLGNTIWDQEVAVYSTNTVLWGGVAGGTGNNIAVTLENGSLETVSDLPVGGQAIAFIVGADNTDATQITVLWTGGGTNGPIELTKSTSSGSAPLVGGELIETNLVFMVYDDSSGNWMIVNNSTSADTVFAPTCFSVDQPLAGMKCVLVLVRSYTLPEDATGSYAYAEELPTAEVVVSIRKNASVIGTVTFGTGDNDGVIAVASEVTFIAGDRLVLQFPETVDVTLGALGVTFRLQRTSSS